jgi:uncharacterized protein YbaP (TraB family)
MRNLLICLLIMVGWGSSLLAQKPQSPNGEAYHPIENSLLWEITGKGLKRPSYLFGTIHLIPKDSFFISEVMRERMPEADRLVLEVELNMGTMLSSALEAFTPPAQSLSELLSEEDYAYLKSFVEDSLEGSGGFMGLGGVSMASIENQKPIFAIQQIASLYCSDMQVNNGESVMYEMYLADEFKMTERPVSGLETAGEQLAAFDKIPLEEQATQLMETIRNPGQMCGEFDRMVKVYRQQDLSTLMRLTSEDPGIGNHLDVLLDQRNKNWIPKIEEMLKGEVLFIAVGAGHLAGKNGVVNLLREQGYTLKPLRDPQP